MKTMKTLNQLTGVSVTWLVSMSCLFGVAPSLTAQVPSTPDTDSDSGSIDDLSDDPNQMTIWTCRQGDKKIEVEAQKYSAWQKKIEEEGWECSQPQQFPDQVSGATQFNCEPEEGTLGILTVTWLEGEGGNEQMQAWMEEIESKPDQGCQMGQVQPWDVDVESNLEQQQ
jgi:hypothetical protein